MRKPNKSVLFSKFDSRLLFLTRVGVFLSLLTPLAWLPFVWHPFEAGKVWYFQTVVALTFPAWVLLAFRQPCFRLRQTLFHWALVAQFAVWTLAALFAKDAHVAFFGVTDKMDGLLTLLHFGAFFVMAASLMQDETERKTLFLTVLGISLVSATLAVIQRFVPTLLGPAASVHVSGTLGNQVFLSGFHAVTVMMTVFFWKTYSPLQRSHIYICVSNVVMSVVAMLMAGSRGGIVALVSALGGTFLAYGLLRKQRKVLLGLAGGLGAAVLAYIAIVVWAMPHPALKGFWSQNTSLRHLFELHDLIDRWSAWKLTLPGLGDRPILGWGMGNYEALFNTHYLTSEGCAYTALNDAHNLVLTLLATTGILGTVAYVFLLAVGMRQSLRTGKDNEVKRWPAALLLGVWIATQVPLLFNPNSVGQQFLFFFVMAFTSAWTQSTSPRAVTDSTPLTFWQLPLGLALGAVTALFVNILPAQASYVTVLASRAHHAQDTITTLANLKRAANIPTPYLEEQLAVGLNHVSRLAEQGKLQQMENWQEVVGQNRAWASSFLKHSQRLYFHREWIEFLYKVGMAVNASALVEEAQTAYRELYESKPTRHEVAFSYGEFLARRGQLDEAERIFQSIWEADTSIGQSAFRYGAFVWKYKKEADRGSLLIRAGTQVPCLFSGSNVTEMSQVAQGLFRQKDIEGLKSILPFVEHDRPGPNERAYSQMASYYEDLGLIKERDVILRTAIRRVKGSERKFSAVLEGKKTVAQVNQLTH